MAALRGDKGMASSGGDELSALTALPHESKLAAYQSALASRLPGPVDGTQELLNHLLSEDVPLTLSRQLLSSFASSFRASAPDEAAAKALAKHAIDRIQPRRVSFEEQLATIRENLAVLHEAAEEWSDAARCLAGIDLDSGVRSVDDQYKLSMCVKIAMLFLEDDDAVAAETHVKRAAFLLAGRDTAAAPPSDAHKALELQYKVGVAHTKAHWP